MRGREAFWFKRCLSFQLCAFLLRQDSYLALTLACSSIEDIPEQLPGMDVAPHVVFVSWILKDLVATHSLRLAAFVFKPLLTSVLLFPGLLCPQGFAGPAECQSNAHMPWSLRFVDNAKQRLFPPLRFHHVAHGNQSLVFRMMIIGSREQAPHNVLLLAIDDSFYAANRFQLII